jgi:hypothetical protein
MYNYLNILDLTVPDWFGDGYDGYGDNGRHAKIRIFGRRAARDNLATTKSKYRRTLETMSTCKLSGMTEESSFHATVSCTKARVLREKTMDYWDLPPENHVPVHWQGLASCSSRLLQQEPESPGPACSLACMASQV